MYTITGCSAYNGAGTPPATYSRALHWHMWCDVNDDQHCCCAQHEILLFFLSLAGKIVIGTDEAGCWFHRLQATIVGAAHMWMCRMVGVSCPPNSTVRMTTYYCSAVNYNSTVAINHQNSTLRFHRFCLAHHRGKLQKLLTSACITTYLYSRCYFICVE